MITTVEKHAPLTEKGQRWAEFLDGLEPWEIHKLHTVGELELHDRYMNSNNPNELLHIFALVCVKGDEDTFSKRV